MSIKIRVTSSLLVATDDDGVGDNCESSLRQPVSAIVASCI